MKKEQKIALALVLIGGVTQMNNKNKVESRNIKSRDKFFEILKKDYDNGNKYGIKLRDQILENDIELSDDYGMDKNEIFSEIYDQEIDKDYIKYLNSVIRRSRIYLGYYMKYNLEHIIFLEIDEIDENDYSGPMQKENDYNGNITAALEIIANDYNDKKVIYNELIKGQSDIKSRKSNLEAINEVKNALVNIDFELDNKPSLDTKLEAIVKALEKIGYYDQE